MTPPPNNDATPQPLSEVDPGALLESARALLSGGDLEAAHASMQAEMEMLSERVRIAILKCDAKQLIGYLWTQLLMGQFGYSDEGPFRPAEALDDLMFALEYVHAVLSGHAHSEHGKSADADDLGAVLTLATELRQGAMFYCLVAARRTPEGLFGPETSTVAMQAMTSWVTLRGHRYQALEREFFEFVLQPHDEALRSVC